MAATLRPARPAGNPDLAELAGHLNAANARWLSLIAEFDRREARAEWGVKSCAHWLNWKCGLELGAAREKLRVADTATEEYFLNVALHGTAHQVAVLVPRLRMAHW